MEAKKRPIFFDTETTGIKHDRDHIVEIAAYDPLDERTFVSFVNPGVPIPADAARVHGISDEMVKDSPAFDEVGQQFADFCGSDAVLVAHNNDGFDKLFIASSFARHGLTLPQWTYFDTLKWARRYRPDLPRHTLQILREVYGIEANNAHRALDDVIILYKIYKKMTDDLSIEMCINLLSQPSVIRTMPFGKHQGKSLNDVPKSYLNWLLSEGALDKPDNAELKSSLEALSLI